MNGLRILSIDNTQVQWIYKGQYGTSAISPNDIVLAAMLVSQDFDLVPPTGAQIISECQTRVDQEAGTHTGPRRFRVRVTQRAGNSTHDYSVLAHNANAAIMLAFALDGGLGSDTRRIEKGHLELAKEYCEVVE